MAYYAFFENVTEPIRKTPKFKKTKSVGYLPPMEELKNRDGEVVVYYQTKQGDEQGKPSYWLQAKNGLNLTGLKDYYVNGKLGGFAYGYPYGKETYSKDNKKNPFYMYRKDGFLFKFHYRDDGDIGSFEMIVLSGAKMLIASYCKLFVDCGFDDDLERLREMSE